MTFDDTTTQVFLNSEDEIFPLVTTRANLDHADLTNLISSPNHNSNIKTAGSASAYLSSQGLRKHWDSGLPIEPFNETRVFLNDKSNKFYATGTSPNVYPGFSSPLRDKIAISIPVFNRSNKFITRFNNNNLPTDANGLFPDGNFASTGFYYYNFADNKWEDKGLDDNYMMFYRVNPITNKWDPGSEIGPAGQLASSVVGSSTKMQQFKMSDHLGVMIDSIADSTRAQGRDPYSILTSSLGYHLIGAPTQTGLAPWHSKYFATSSQTQAVSSYIAHPFLFEKAVIEIPVIVQRMRGKRSTAAALEDNVRYHDSCRDIDNYVFFLYRQTGPERCAVDSKHHASSSRRMLICSGAASFYNSNAFSGDIPKLVRQRGLPHKPAFSYDFLAASGSNSGGNPTAPLITAFTGTIRIEMKAAIGNGQAIGCSRFPVLSTTVGKNLPNPKANGSGARSMIIQDWWGGGTRIFSSSLTATSGKNSVTTPDYMINSKVFVGDRQFNFAGGLRPFSANATTRLGCRTGRGDAFRDPRSLKPNLGGGKFSPSYLVGISDRPNGLISGENDMGVVGYTQFPVEGAGTPQGFPIMFGGRASSEVSPYLFLPGDQIILGIDAGVSMLPSSASADDSTSNLVVAGVDPGADLGFYSASDATIENFGCMSGSFMKILRGDAKITLFGSLVRESREVFGELNQGLTSDAIHEAVGSDRVLDQYDIATRLDLSGTYVDNFVAGGMIENVNSTNALVAANGLNAVGKGLSDGRASRRMGFFSKNHTGIESSIENRPNADYYTGAPPRFNRVFNDVANNDYILYDIFNISPTSVKIFDKLGIRSLQRFVTFIDSHERYYDSMMPDIANFAKRSPGLIKHKIDQGTFEYRIHVLPNAHKGYPYQTDPPRYLTQKFYARIHSTHWAGTSATTYYDFKSTEARKLINTSIFGIGFRYEQSQPDGLGYCIRRFRHPVSGAFGSLYGVINSSPMYSQTVFRRDSYGQFRDMLEQRKDSKYFLVNINDNGTNTLADSPVQVKFVNSSDGSTRVSPFSTDSFNFSNEYTSSYPYSDGYASIPSFGNRTFTTIDLGDSAFVVGGTAALSWRDTMGDSPGDD